MNHYKIWVGLRSLEVIHCKIYEVSFYGRDFEVLMKSYITNKPGGLNDCLLVIFEVTCNRLKVDLLLWAHIGQLWESDVYNIVRKTHRFCSKMKRWIKKRTTYLQWVYQRISVVDGCRLLLSWISTFTPSFILYCTRKYWADAGIFYWLLIVLKPLQKS